MLKKKLSAKKRREDKTKVVTNQQRTRKVTQQEKAKIVEETLKPYFSPTQISFFLRKNPKKGRGWSHQDMQNALTLRLLSKRTYKYLRSKKWIPLPG